jgi:hypothetical protein
MRRWSTLLAAFSLLAIMSGCWDHTAGVCDCDPWHDQHPFLTNHGVEHSYADVPHGAAIGAGMIVPGTVAPANGDSGSPVTTPQPMPTVEE